MHGVALPRGDGSAGKLLPAAAAVPRPRGGGEGGFVSPPALRSRDKQAGWLPAVIGEPGSE